MDYYMATFWLPWGSGQVYGDTHPCRKGLNGKRTNSHRPWSISVDWSINSRIYSDSQSRIQSVLENWISIVHTSSKIDNSTCECYAYFELLWGYVDFKVPFRIYYLILNSKFISSFCWNNKLRSKKNI